MFVYDTTFHPEIESPGLKLLAIVFDSKFSSSPNFLNNMFANGITVLELR